MSKKDQDKIFVYAQKMMAIAAITAIIAVGVIGILAIILSIIALDFGIFHSLVSSYNYGILILIILVIICYIVLRLYNSNHE